MSAYGEVAARFYSLLALENWTGAKRQLNFCSLSSDTETAHGMEQSGIPTLAKLTVRVPKHCLLTSALDVLAQSAKTQWKCNLGTFYSTHVRHQ